MAENPVPHDIRTISTEHRKFAPIRQVKKWGGRATLAMSAAALVTACTSPSPVSHEPNKGKPTSTYSAQEIPSLPHQHSVTETFNALRGDSNIPKNGGSIDISHIAGQFKKSDYVDVVSTPPGHPDQENFIDTGSAPVMEIRFDKTTKSFIYSVQSPKGLDNQELYQLLLPVMQDSTLLTTAFENNDVTRVAIRLEAPPIDPSAADYTSDSYVQEDWSTPKEGMQKTVFLFLPGVRKIDTQEIRDTLRHETIHGLTGKDSLSENIEAPATPNSNELAQWNAACVDIRDFALQDAEKYKQSSIESMAELSNQLHNPTATEILTQITDALKNGTFERYQPQQGDNPNEAFSGKVPDCTTIGPWGVFVRLMNEKGLNSVVENIFSSTSNEAAGNTAATLHDNWQTMNEFQTIYSVLREGTYEQDSSEKLLGHEFDNWDELVTSTSDVCIAYPEKVATSIEELPPERRAAALQLVRLTLTTLNAQVPPDRNPDFHALITNRLETINRLS